MEKQREERMAGECLEGKIRTKSTKRYGRIAMREVSFRMLQIAFTKKQIAANVKTAYQQKKTFMKTTIVTIAATAVVTIVENIIKIGVGVSLNGGFLRYSLILSSQASVYVEL